MNILITGCAGFIGHHLSKKLLNKKNNTIIGIDSVDKRFDAKLKTDRLYELQKYKNFKFFKQNISNYKKNEILFKKYKFDKVIHLAAKAGVRYSIYNPKLYIQSNINGFFNILDLSRRYQIKHFLFASSSSVYGKSKIFPQSEEISSDNPESFYAATKKSNELMAHSYSSIYGIPCTGIRFFTVYGEFVRQDMALHKFVSSINKNKKINVFNYGNHQRDFTHVSDVVKVVVKLINKPAKSKVPYQILNLGSARPSSLENFIGIIEKNLGKKANINQIKLQSGDVIKTEASIKKLRKVIKIHKFLDLKKGIYNFVKWYKSYYIKK
tara:strand:- start:90 stop:1061 length:972 start_codon:yes stop_codon:yes gene_type:complete